jgi:hypothetical protein
MSSVIGWTGSSSSVTKAPVHVKRLRLFQPAPHILLARQLPYHLIPHLIGSAKFQQVAKDSDCMIDDAKSLPIPTEQAEHIRRLCHDLSNALEIVVQTNYLLGMLELDENGRQWHTMLDQGVQQASNVNRELRDYIRANS